MAWAWLPIQTHNFLSLLHPLAYPQATRPIQTYPILPAVPLASLWQVPWSVRCYATETFLDVGFPSWRRRGDRTEQVTLHSALPMLSFLCRRNDICVFNRNNNRGVLENNWLNWSGFLLMLCLFSQCSLRWPELYEADPIHGGNIAFVDNNLSCLSTLLCEPRSSGFLVLGDAGNHFILRIVVMTAFILLTDFDFLLLNLRLTSCCFGLEFSCFSQELQRFWK